MGAPHAASIDISTHTEPLDTTFTVWRANLWRPAILHRRQLKALMSITAVEMIASSAWDQEQDAVNQRTLVISL